MVYFKAVKLAKKLMPNRHVVINPARKHNSAGKRRNGTIPVKPETGGGNQTKGKKYAVYAVCVRYSRQVASHLTS